MIRRTVFGRQYGGSVKLTTNTASSIRFYISTRGGLMNIDWGDGTFSTNVSSPLGTNVDFVQIGEVTSSPGLFKTYSSQEIRDIYLKFINGIDDAYSIMFTSYQTSYTNMIYIVDWGTFIKQFKNLYSLYYNVGSNLQTIIGDASQIPDNLERIYFGNMPLQNSSDFYLNVSNFSATSKLKYFRNGSINSSLVNTYGNLVKLPNTLEYFYLTQNSGTFTYSGTKVWASSFDTLDIGNASMVYNHVDNLFNDMANSITTAIGSKVIRLVNCYRTSASNSAVAYLQSLGYTITVAGVLTNPIKIIDLPLQNNFTDSTGLNTMIAGGTSNLPTFTLEGSEYAATFNGSQSIKTNANLNIGADKISVSFWIKTYQTTNGGVLETSSDAYVNNAIKSTINEFASNKIAIIDHNSGFNIGSSVVNINNNVWNHVVMTIDRSQGTSQNKIYINGTLSYAKNSSFATDNVGLFSNLPLIVGQTARNVGFVGQIKLFKMFNYPLSQTEITNLYNKTI